MWKEHRLLPKGHVNTLKAVLVLLLECLDLLEIALKQRVEILLAQSHFFQVYWLVESKQTIFGKELFLLLF